MQAMNEHLPLFIEFTQFSLSELLLHAECIVGIFSLSVWWVQQVILKR